MNDPWVPPYFGSWEELINALLHDPFLGGGGEGPHHRRHFVPSIDSEAMRMAGPSPISPWRMAPDPQPWRLAASYLVSTISLKEAAARLQDEQLKKELIERADQSISRFIDDYCGTPPHIPWPRTGPPWWVQPTVSELVMVAHSFPEGSFRNEILNVAGTMVQVAYTART